ncbi:LysR family transcriptional regulator [Pseudomonas sp. TH31]|uniref:LysR family transcriptional regulator n=1 Tax=Pseudomonas sp. TH31 TaxID=2796396 RepID=UPI00191490BB|nr:LysR family transcriptional regulator [Pseudomonas sp. TH31]MBK5416071.1 LysR family transcriptional regulator [Pseudomonas sp. TH31]
MAINFRVFKSFVAAVEARSLSGAATRLHLAQPALSQHIAQLEAHFSLRLLVRSNLGVSPTTAGQALYDHAQRVLYQLEVTEREVRRAGECLAGNVSLGLATYSSLSLLTTPAVGPAQAAPGHQSLSERQFRPDLQQPGQKWPPGPRDHLW